MRVRVFADDLVETEFYEENTVSLLELKNTLEKRGYDLDDFEYLELYKSSDYKIDLDSCVVVRRSEFENLAG